MEKVLTISVAAYNIEKYIDQLMDSIVCSKKMDEIEVLIVNDGSKDKTAEIGQRYHEQYPGAVFLIDKENGGHGSTINVGIKRATGKFFKAIDGDDWVDSEGLKSLVEFLKTCETDLVITDFKNVYEETGRESVRKCGLIPNKVYDFNQTEHLLDAVCYHNVVFRSSLLKNRNIALTEHSFYVDNELIAYPLPYVDTVVYCEALVYCYRLEREGQSVSLKSVQKNELQHLQIVYNLLKFYQEKCVALPDAKKKSIAEFISSVVVFQLNIQFSFRKSKERLHKLIEFDNQVKKTALIYESMKNRTYRIWRKGRTLLYIPTWYWLQKKN